MLAADGQDRHRGAVVVIATDRGIRESHGPGDLLRDGREHVCRCRTTGDERGNSPQCRLLFGKPFELNPVVLLWTRHLADVPMASP